MQSRFTEHFKTKTNQDLFNYTNAPHEYEKKAVLTAIYELETRKITTPEIEALKLEFETALKQQSQKSNTSSKKEIPKPVKDATNIIYAGVIIGLLSPIMMNLIYYVQITFNFIGIFWFLIINGSILTMGYLIRSGAVFIRNIFAILTGFSLLFLPSLVEDIIYEQDFISELFIAQPILYVYATYLLYKSESRTWFKSQK